MNLLGWQCYRCERRWMSTDRETFCPFCGDENIALIDS